MLNPLRYFVEVAQSGSIRAAAERLHVAASAISRHIQIFEDECGVPLFERRARGMELTAAGEIYFRYACGVLMDGDRARLEIDELKGLRRGHIRICTIDGVVAGPLADVVATFRKKYPGVSCALRAMGTQDVMRTVRDGDADVGIAFHSLPLAGVRIMRRIPDPLYAIVAPDHPLAGAHNVSLAQALKYPLALPEGTFGIRQLVNTACHVGELRPDIVLETNSIEALRGFARSGGGIAMMPLRTAAREISLGTVVPLLVDEPTLRGSSTDVCVREGRVLPAVVSEFLQFVYAGFDS